MVRGTTPTHTFTFPIEVNNFSRIRIIYKQGDTVILRKEMKDLVCDGFTVKTRLTQEETLKFDDKKLVRIQIRTLTLNGDADASVIDSLRPGELLEDDVFENEDTE